MLKAEIDNKGCADIDIDGKAWDITRDVMLIVGAVFDALAEDDNDAGEFFREHVTRFAMDDGFWAAARGAKNT